MAKYVYLLILSLAISAVRVSGYAGGAPQSDQICQDLTPKHGEDPQSSASPYKLTIDKSNVKPGETVRLTISGAEFKGFLVQGRKVGGNDKTPPVGKFTGAQNARDAQTMNCGNSVASSVTHTNNTAKNSVTLNWVAPDAKGTYQLLTTVVRDGATYWVRQPSPSINVN